MERQGTSGQEDLEICSFTDSDSEVIKIFGVYTHAQFDNRLWNSIGYQLGTKGKGIIFYLVFVWGFKDLQFLN